jgi:hypothetical protein
MDIPTILKPDFAACPCCWYAHTRAGDQECFIPRATMAIAPGEKAATKGSTRLPQTFLPVAGGGGDGSGGGGHGVAGVFPPAFS